MNSRRTASASRFLTGLPDESEWCDRRQLAHIHRSATKSVHHAERSRAARPLRLITRPLRRRNHLYRYASEDDFGTSRTSFTVCTLWYIDALAAIGRREEGRETFEHLLSCRNHIGLLSEDIDPDTGELWGNFPQTYSMVGLIVSAMRLSKSWDEAFWRS